MEWGNTSQVQIIVPIVQLGHILQVQLQTTVFLARSEHTLQDQAAACAQRVEWENTRLELGWDIAHGAQSVLTRQRVKVLVPVVPMVSTHLVLEPQSANRCMHLISTLGMYARIVIQSRGDSGRNVDPGPFSLTFRQVATASSADLARFNLQLEQHTVVCAILAHFSPAWEELDAQRAVLVSINSSMGRHSVFNARLVGISQQICSHPALCVHQGHTRQAWEQQWTVLPLQL